ncbi:YgeY family selenium metabolism-linked hydrolase [Caldilinea sp.]|uniref:YgeY family selenium metabolism-linked hydrolase n=1 Tax=Caldilinea sp. TaxID=2293560 RepID=UPI0021DF273A|nr:YgeY family selenium metabolism-linked hydrolase [Caldilinea sp.]GIV67553.1 MAG: peptidase [Caldilinea sp.]
MNINLNDTALVAFTQDLVRIPSLSGEEGPAVERVVAEMHRLGFDEVFVDENGSAVGIVNGARPGPTILLDAHIDTVGIAPGSTWTRDPFGAVVEDGYIYGRGAADMKGALAAMVYAVGSLDRSALAGRAVVSATVMEEVLEGIALESVMERVRPDFVVIGEATQLNLNRGGRGRAEIHLETLGVPAHSSSPHLGVNAVHEMIKLIHIVESTPLDSHPLLGPALLALTDIISDPYPAYSVTPSRCRVTYDRRTLPGETPESVLGAILNQPEAQGLRCNAVIAQGEHRTYTGKVLQAQKFFPAWEFAEEHPFVQMALRGLRTARLNPQLRAYRFCTNAASSAGKLGAPTVGFGPAAEEDAHVVDERLSIAELTAAARGYAGIVQEALRPS